MAAKTEAEFNLLEEAQRVFDSVLTQEPSNFLALYGKALAMFKSGKLIEYVENMAAASKLQPVETKYNINELKLKIENLTELKGSQNQNQILSTVPEMPRVTVINSTTLNEKDKSLLCTLCDKNFSKTFSLNRHMLLHTGEKPHKCPTCGKAFIQKTDLERHLTTHSDILNFECIDCKKRFKTKKNLNCHMSTHSTDRPFKCQFCEKSFKVKRMLKFHEGLHTGEKPYACDICEKSFPAKPYLKSHLKTHDEEKPFTCNFCQTCFKRNYDLNFHIRNQHKALLE